MSEPVICAGCGHEIDPEVCGCGEYMDGHVFDGHYGIPMGCACYMAPTPVQTDRVPQDTRKPK